MVVLGRHIAQSRLGTFNKREAKRIYLEATIWQTGVLEESVSNRTYVAAAPSSCIVLPLRALALLNTKTTTIKKEKERMGSFKVFDLFIQSTCQSHGLRAIDCAE